MKTFIRKHLEGSLIFGTIILIGVLAFSLFWSLTFVSQSVDSVFQSAKPGVQAVDFNISGAEHLNLRGAVQ